MIAVDWDIGNKTDLILCTALVVPVTVACFISAFNSTLLDMIFIIKI